MFRRSIVSVFLFVCVAPLLAQIDPTAATPPVAKKIPKTDITHGETRIDNYFWLREKEKPEVTAYLNAENAYMEAVMKPTKPLQDNLYKEMLGRIKQTDSSVPFKHGDYWYYTREEEGKQYKIHCRKKENLDAAEQIILDENEAAKGNKFFAIGLFAVSDDANLLAFSTDITGYRQYTLRIKDLRTGELMPDRVERVDSAAWATDNRTLFYVVEDEAKRAYRLYRHVLGEKKDELIYEEKDELYTLSVARTRDKAMILLDSESFTSNEWRYVSADQPTAAWKIVMPREKEHEYSVDHRDGLFYIRTNKDAKNFRLVTASVAEPSKWKELIPHRPAVLLEGIDLFKQYCVVQEKENGLPQLRVMDLSSGQDHRITFDEPVYAVAEESNPEFDTGTLRFRYESLVTPDSIYDYDMNTRKRVLKKRKPVLGGYDESKYTSERIFATASDGTKVPVSLVYKKGLAKDGTAPLLLYGYGAYGFAYPANFSTERLSLLDRGVIYAHAHIRGGNEMGRHWYDDGKMTHKRNTFTDFIAAADYLVKEKYCARDRLVIQGGSAGGLLIGATLNFRPDLCKAAVLQVPFVDVINTMLDESLPLTAQEFLEWGNPKVKTEFDYMKTYCPYTNIAAKDYPAILVETSLNDSQVMYHEPAKYVAKMRATKTDKNVLVFKINMEAGHGGASGRYDALKEDAFTYAFILNQLGIPR